MNRDKIKQLQEIRAALDKILEIKPAKYPAINFIKSWRDEVQAEIDLLYAEEESIWDRFKIRDQVRVGTMQGWVHTIDDKGSKDNFGVRYVVTVQFPSGPMTFNDYTLHHLEKVNQFSAEDTRTTNSKDIVMRWHADRAEMPYYVRYIEQKAEEAKDAFSTIAARAAGLLKERNEAQARIAELEKELESRPRIWCVRNDNGEIMKQSAYDRMAQSTFHFDGLFPSRELASRLFVGEAVPYTGEKS